MSPNLMTAALKEDSKCRAGIPDKCLLAAGEFVDQNARDTYREGTDVANYFTQYRRGSNRTPRVWSWHAYRDAHHYPRRVRTSEPNFYIDPRAVLKAAKQVAPSNKAAPPVWLTE